MGCLDPHTVREDFPTLNRKIHGNPLIYFDNAASSLKPLKVIQTVSDFYLNHYSNIHRGVHTISQEATSMYEEAREKVAQLIGAKLEEVIFTSGTTDSLNLVAYGYGLKILEKGDEVLLTVMEHHSNMLPWRNVARMKGAKVKYVEVDAEGRLRYDELEEKLGERTKIVAVTHMSNVLGTVNDIHRVAKLAHEAGAVIVVDGAQSVPHMKIDVKRIEADFLAFSGHKMLGPTGIGVLWVKRELIEELSPGRLGGGAVRDVSFSDVLLADSPHRFEAGTPNIAGAIGLGAAVDYLTNLGMENVERHERELVIYTLKLMEEELGGLVEVYGPKPEERGGIIPFNVRGLTSDLVGALLDGYGIAVRTGRHCAHPLHSRLGLKGTVRASYYIYNTREEVERMVSALGEITREAGT